MAVIKVTNIYSQGYKMQNNLPYGGHLFLRIDRKMVKIYLENILYIESARAHIKIYRHLDTPLLVKQSLNSIKSILPQQQFMRIHRSFIISINRITAFTNHDVEIDKIEIPIGRQFLGHLKKIAH